MKIVLPKTGIAEENCSFEKEKNEKSLDYGIESFYGLCKESISSELYI